MTTLTDNFNRANNAPLSPSAQGWSWLGVASNGQIISNQATSLNVASIGAIIVAADSALSTADIYTQYKKYGASASGRAAGPITRKDSSVTNTFYLAQIYNPAGTPGMQLYKCVNGSFSQLGSTITVADTDGDVIRVQAVGTTIEAVLNGASIVSVSDGSIDGITTGGKLGGFRIGDSSDANLFVDDFEAGDVGGGGGGVFVPIIGRGPGMALVGPGGLAG